MENVWNWKLISAGIKWHRDPNISRVLRLASGKGNSLENFVFRFCRFRKLSFFFTWTLTRQATMFVVGVRHWHNARILIICFLLEHLLHKLHFWTKMLRNCLCRRACRNPRHAFQTKKTNYYHFLSPPKTMLKTKSLILCFTRATLIRFQL